MLLVGNYPEIEKKCGSMIDNVTCLKKGGGELSKKLHNTYEEVKEEFKKQRR